SLSPGCQAYRLHHRRSSPGVRSRLRLRPTALASLRNTSWAQFELHPWASRWFSLTANPSVRQPARLCCRPSPARFASLLCEKVMNVQFPYSFDTRGRTADSDQDTNPQNRHIRDLIEQVLFTAPGERVNRPEFGCGLLQVVFAPNSAELVTATQYLVQGALQNILGDLISLNDVAVSASDNELTVLVQYTVRSTQQQQVARFSTGGSSL